MPFEKCHFTSTQQQKLMFLCHENGSICYKDQDIYKNERSFEIAVWDLIRQKIMKEDGIRKYLLTSNGEFYVKNIILK